MDHVGKPLAVAAQFFVQPHIASVSQTSSALETAWFRVPSPEPYPTVAACCARPARHVDHDHVRREQRVLQEAEAWVKCLPGKKSAC